MVYHQLLFAPIPYLAKRKSFWETGSISSFSE